MSTGGDPQRYVNPLLPFGQLKSSIDARAILCIFIGAEPPVGFVCMYPYMSLGVKVHTTDNGLTTDKYDIP